MEKKTRLHLFEAFGVELEYMIVKSESLDVAPLADKVLINDQGQIEGEVEHGEISWSNELVSHVIEIKSNGPKADLNKLESDFHANVLKINELLQPSGARLLSSAAHPWMNPAMETMLWSHESHEIYAMYDRIFNCKGHGWSNLQSTHINLPFYDDEEFSKLHTAIRFLMPIIPALTASSPILNSKFTGYYDRRLYYYELNQSKIPAITGKVIPECVYTKHGYQKHIYDKIAKAIAPYDPENTLQPVWLNSRGAIARFDRGAIEIRIIDIQECPKADLAVVALIVSLLKMLVKGKWISFETQQSFDTGALYSVFKGCVKDASASEITNQNYLNAFGVSNNVTGSVLWKMLIEKAVSEQSAIMQPFESTIRQMVDQGTLAERVVRDLEGNYSRENLYRVYQKLADCLVANSIYTV